MIHFKENSLKVIYKIKNELKSIFEDKRVVTKILKMSENNQYGNAMTRPLPTGSIKRVKKISTMREFDLILQSISHTDEIGHLFIVDIEFDKENDTEKKLISTRSIRQFLKKKVLLANEPPAFQPPDTVRLKGKGIINSCQTTAKTHATMVKKTIYNFMLNIDTF